jgi:phosphatidylglycerophosphate synthase
MSTYSLHDALRPPGLVSLLRLPLALAFPFVVHDPAWAIALLLVSSATDIVDGWLARHFHQETATGAVLDGLMDKAFVLTVVITLVATRALTVLEALLLATRDLGEVPLLIHSSIARRLAPRPHRVSNVAGKLATVLQVATIAAVIVEAPHRLAWVLVTAACGAVAATWYWVRELRTA